MQFRRLPKLIIFITVLALVFIVIYVIRDTADEVQISSATLYFLNDGWTLKCDGKITENVTITTADIGVVNDQDVVEISRVLEDTGLDTPCLSFLSQHAITDVYLDDELIYTFGRVFIENNRTVPDKRHHISLGRGYAGKTLKISFTGSRKASFSYFDTIYLGKRSDILTREIAHAWVSILIGFFLFTLGIVLIILSPYLFIYHNNDLRIFFSGLISIMLAIYIMAYNGVFDILINNAFLNTILEYFSLYNIPTTIVGYLMSTYTGKEKKIFLGMFYTNMTLFPSFNLCR